MKDTEEFGKIYDVYRLENDHTSQSNLQIRCKPSENPNAFHKNRKYS
jgi:hypothetical protein